MEQSRKKEADLSNSHCLEGMGRLAEGTNSGFAGGGEMTRKDRMVANKCVASLIHTLPGKARKHRRISGPVLLVAILFTAILAGRDSHAVTGPSACDFSNETSRFVTARISNLDIAGAELQFPVDYVFSLPFTNGAERDGLLLRADAKDFSSYPETKQFLPNGGSKLNAGIRDYVQILITANVPMLNMLKNTLSNKYKVFGHTYSGTAPMNSKGVRDGLLAPTGYVADGFLKDDIFYQIDQFSITDVIVCSNASRVPNPSCRHTFEVGAYDVKITYGRAELSRWRALREGTAKLLQCFTTKDPRQLP